MRVEKLGEGEPEYVVVGSVHGDEPCGKRAIERFISEDWEVKKPVKFVIANEEALEENERYLEADLNRSFPGDPESEKHEERLAAEIAEEIRGLKMLDIHSTHSEPVPFATFSCREEDVISLVRSTGASRAVNFPDSSGTTRTCVKGAIVEVGPQGTEEAAEMAYNILVNFLASEGVIDAEFERSDPEIFEYYGTVEGSGYTFLAKNFQEINKGEVFAERDSEKLEAEESFFPVLMSTNGYEDKVGLKARKLTEPLK